MLAFLPEDEIEVALALPRTKYTSYTIVERTALLENLEEIRRSGYAVDNMEHEYDIRCVAIPVFNSERRLVATVSVSGPSLRFDPASITKFYNTLTEVIQPIQVQL